MIRFNPHPASDAPELEANLSETHSGNHPGMKPKLKQQQSFMSVPRQKGFLQTIRSHFPESSSQVALIVSLIGAVAISAVWLWWILSTRWLEEIRNPTTVLTREHLDSIPMIEAISINFPPDYFGLNAENLPYHLVEVFHIDYTSTTRLSQDDIRCPDIVVYGYDAVCQPYINGQEAFPASLSGKPRLDVSNWPLQYHNRGDSFQLNVHALLNTSNVVPLSYKQPHVDAFILSAEQLIKAKDLTFNGTTPPIADFLPFLNNLPRYVAMQFGYEYDMALTLTKRIDVNGFVEYDWNMSESMSPLPLSDAQIEYLWSQMLANYSAAEQTKLQNLRVADGIKYFPVVISLAPSSFDVQVITQKVTYGFLGFVSDVGGFLNILALAFTIIFPFSHALIRPRVFLPFYFYRLLRSGTIEKMDAERREIERQQVEKEEEDALGSINRAANGIIGIGTESDTTEMVQMGGTEIPVVQVQVRDAQDIVPVENESVDIKVQPL